MPTRVARFSGDFDVVAVSKAVLGIGVESIPITLFHLSTFCQVTVASTVHGHFLLCVLLSVASGFMALNLSYSEMHPSVSL